MTIMIRYTICTYTNIYLREHTNLEFRQTKLDLSAELRLCATRVLIHKENKEYFEYQHKHYKIVVYVHVSYESTRTYKTYIIESYVFVTRRKLKLGSP